MLATRRIDFDTLRRTAPRDDGPFGDHLRYYLTKLYEFKDLLQAFEQVLRNGTCSDPRLFDNLKGFGLVTGEERKARARNQLYASYFRQRLRPRVKTVAIPLSDEQRNLSFPNRRLDRRPGLVRRPSDLERTGTRQEVRTPTCSCRAVANSSA